MNDISRGPGQGRRRPNKNAYVTKSGKTIKLNQSLGERMKARRNASANRKAAYLSTLPKNPWMRVLHRLNPKQLAAYWFSREGGIMALKITGIGIVVCFFLAVGVFAYFRKDLPKIKDISGNKIGGSITYYDRTGSQVLWQDYDGVKRIPVEGKEMSDYVKNATIAIEDKNFYNHGAFDITGILRAGINDIKGGPTQGGSTITQQLVKLDQQWTNERTYTRKIKELILAVELEREYSKADILTGYLNMAPYGGVEYGVESAARDYFGTTAKKLTLAQSAMLAAIPKSPGIYSPYNSPTYNPSATEDYFEEDDLIGRQRYILDRMVEQNMITREEAEAAKKDDILAQIKPLKPKYEGIQAPYFVLSAKNELERKYGSETIRRGGWRVITTLNLDLQKVAEQKVAETVPRISRHGGDTAAFVAADVKTGQIVSLVGGADFNDVQRGGQLNFGSKQKVSPGSSVKPYDYAALINYSNNVGAGSVLYDVQGAIPGYPCTNKNSPKTDDKANCLWNYDFRYPGPVTLRYALGGSRNVPAVKAMLTVGVDKTIKMMEDLMGTQDGYACYKAGTDVSNASKSDEDQCYASSSIGDGSYVTLDNHVNGIASLSRNGAVLPKTYILKITDGSGKPILEWSQPKAKQVIKPDAAYIVNDMMADPNASYLPASYKFHRQKNGWNFAIKTGTTNDNYDGLMATWSTQYAAISWIGHHTRQQEIKGTSMEVLTSPIARGWMEAAHANLKAENWTAPNGIKKLPAFVVRNKVSSLGEVVPSQSTDLFPSWYQPKSAGSGSQTTDKVSNKIATSCTPTLAKQTFGNSNVNLWNVDQWAGGGNNTGNTSSTATDDVHKCSDAPPSITVTAPASCDAEDGGCTVTATVTQGTHPLTSQRYAQFPGTVNFTIDGQVIKTFNVNESPSTVSFNYMPTSSGNITITAQVIDSVLYQATDTASIGVTAPEGLKFESAKLHRYRWSGGVGPFRVYYTDVPAMQVCESVDRSCSGTGPTPPKKTRLTVEDARGTKAEIETD